MRWRSARAMTIWLFKLELMVCGTPLLIIFKSRSHILSFVVGDFWKSRVLWLVVVQGDVDDGHRVH
jgi:hypothetical protein